MRPALMFAALLMAAPLFSAPAAQAQDGIGDLIDSRVVFPASASQGALVIGKVPAGSSVRYAGRDLRVSSYGSVVFGIGRDEKGPLQVQIRRPDGSSETAAIAVTARDWPTERVNGVPPKTVNPPPAIAERIKREQAQVTAARARDDNRTDFTQTFIWPVQGRISGRFGNARVYNGQPGAGHSGMDIAVPTGTPVKAPAAGVVTFAGPDLYLTGGTLLLDHGFGVSSNFLHLSRIDVKVGDRVEQGQVIAAVGATGRATGPHLHWGMNWFDTRIDPLLVPALPCDGSAARGPPHAQQRAHGRGFNRFAGGLRRQTCTRQARPHPACTWTGHAGAPPFQQLLRPTLCSVAGIFVQQAARNPGHASVLQALGQGLQQHGMASTLARLVGKHHGLDRSHRVGIVAQCAFGTGSVQRYGARLDQIRQRLGKLHPRCPHRLQHASQRMPRTLRGPAAQFLAPPRQLGVRRQRVASGVEHVVEFLQQREPRQRHMALRFGHERLGHRPFRPAAAPLVEETIQRGTAHYVVPYGWAGVAGRFGQRLASCRSPAFSTSTSACQANGSSLCRR